MKVIKRNGDAEELNFNKISSRITKQCWDLNRDFVDPIQVATKVISGAFDGITTTELDKLSVEQSASLSSIHSDYSKLASRLAITNLYKHTNKSFSKTIKQAYEYVHPIRKRF
jgi:ribonucleoside-diphosphate reductase alpha chain